MLVATIGLLVISPRALATAPIERVPFHYLLLLFAAATKVVLATLSPLIYQEETYV